MNGAASRRLKDYSFRGLGLFLLVILLSGLDWAKSREILQHADLRLMMLAGFCNFAFILLKAFRWHALLYLQEIHYGLARALRIYQAGSFFSVITPGRVGDLIKITYLKRDLGILHRFGLVSVIFDRLFDLITLGLSAVIFVLIERASVVFGISVALFVVLLVVGCILLFSAKFLDYSLRLVELMPVLGKRVIDKRAELKEWHASLWQLVRPGLIIPFLYSCLAYFCLFLGGYLLAIGQQIEISFVQTGYCIALANIVALLPFSVAGVGTRDLAIVILFASFGLSREQALLFSLGYLVLNLLFANLLGAWFWFKEHDLKERAYG